MFGINRLSLTYVFRSETFLAISCLAERFKRLISSNEVRRCVESKGLKPSHLRREWAIFETIREDEAFFETLFCKISRNRPG